MLYLMRSKRSKETLRSAQLNTGNRGALADASDNITTQQGPPLFLDKALPE